MSYGANTYQIHKKLRLDKRKGSNNWYARLTLPNGKREVKSTGTEEFETAKEHAIKFYYEVEARLANNLPANTRKFKHVAQFAIQRMQDDIAAGAGKQAYKDYISALNRYFIPYFEKVDMAKIDLGALTRFDAWREQHMGRKPAQSTINNHNAALNRVLDEAELRGWIKKSMRPTLLNKGIPTQSRGSYTAQDYETIYTALRTFHTETKDARAAATRETLRNYILFLANTGIRHGTEALGLEWRNIEWHTVKGEDPYLALNVDGKTDKRTTIGRDRVVDFLFRQSKLNPRLNFKTFDDLIASKSTEKVWVTRMGDLATVHNLSNHYNLLLDKLALKKGSDGADRTLYCWRNFYATQDLQRGISTHLLSKQMGNSTLMIDKHYSKYSPLFNAEMHSGREGKKQKKTTPTSVSSPSNLAFKMLKDGTLTSNELLAVLGVGQNGYCVTDEIRTQVLEAKKVGLLDSATMLKILSP